MTSDMEDYLARMFQSQIWAQLGNKTLSDQYASCAEKDYRSKLSSSDLSKIKSFQDANHMPATPLPPCK